MSANSVLLFGDTVVICVLLGHAWPLCARTRKTHHAGFHPLCESQYGVTVRVAIITLQSRCPRSPLAHAAQGRSPIGSRRLLSAAPAYRPAVRAECSPNALCTRQTGAVGCAPPWTYPRSAVTNVENASPSDSSGGSTHRPSRRI